MVFLSFLILKLKVTSLAVLLQGLVLLPVLDTLLEPLLHETSISSDFIYLSSSHFLKIPFSSLAFSAVAIFSKVVLPFGFIIELFEMALHQDLLLRFVHHLKPLSKEGVRVLLEFLLGVRDLHGRAVITKLAS